jgi:hypothetical protein
LNSVSGGKGVDLTQTTSWVGVQHNAAEREELPGDEEVAGSDAFSYG